MAETAMRILEERNLIDCLRALSQPVLGICLGMQLLFSHSDEGDVDMLDIISGQARHFTPNEGKTIPHMGWNSVSWARDHPLTCGLNDDYYFYFVHSYAIPVGGYTIGACDYGEAFSAVVAKDNFMGCQFHPERSSEAGAQILKNFLEMKL
jgi:glutamine amidotransferase